MKALLAWYGCVVVFSYGYLIRNALLGYFSRSIVDQLGAAVAVGAVALAVVWMVRFHRVMRANRVAWACFGLAVVVALAGLASVDPEFPAKRTHVAQYFVLAWLVFLAFKSEERLVARGLVALLITTMLGGLDEMLQGAMAERTFGIADIVTNFCGALAGVSVAVGGQLLRGQRLSWRYTDTADIAAPVAVAAGYFLSLVALYPFRGLDFPLWLLLPVFGGLALLANESRSRELDIAVARAHLAFAAIAATAAGGGAYVQVMGIRFI
ncbi:VanZ family protein [Magnetovibrio sp.]|uniref:VanZ family protein n=1 Tax=Magnetovibrio sp. TaxID=2024836 RepID=UPI002F954A71